MSFIVDGNADDAGASAGAGAGNGEQRRREFGERDGGASYFAACDEVAAREIYCSGCGRDIRGSGVRDVSLQGAPTAPSGPAKITQISHWDKPMDGAQLSPDGHTVAFSSPVGGIEQVFIMLSSGGEPLQLTNDDGDKIVSSFSTDGTEIYYGRFLGKSRGLGRSHARRKPDSRRFWSLTVVPSADGGSIFYSKAGCRLSRE